MKKTLLLLPFACILFSCASTLVKVNPEYSSMDVKESSLGIVVCSDGITVGNPRDVADDLGAGASYEVFQGFFCEQLLAKAQEYGKFKHVSLVNGKTRSDFTNKTEPLKGEKTV